MIKLKNLLTEASEIMENLPPGFDMNDFETVEEFTGQSLMEADEKFLGATTTDLPDSEMSGRFQQVADKTANAVDKFKYPFIHRSNIIDDSGKPIDPNVLKKMIKERPKTILSQNKKMMKSGKEAKFYDLSLPAFKGLIVDEATNEFKIVNTCPGAGACRVYCYAKKGGYVQWKASSLSQTRVLNFLLNDWQGFKSKVLSEISSYSSGGKKKLVIRWHDSGDFLSQKYLQLAYDIAKETPNVTHYAYTKMVGMVSSSQKPDNFVFNYSQGAIAPEEKLINTKIHKHSVVVPKPMFIEFMHKDDESGKWIFNSDDDLKTFKNKMSMKYSIPLESVITYDELMAKPEESNRTDKWNVIVPVGSGDDAAKRTDVLGTYLLIH